MTDEQIARLIKTEPKYTILGSPEDWAKQSATDLTTLDAKTLSEAFPPIGEI